MDQRRIHRILRKISLINLIRKRFQNHGFHRRKLYFRWWYHLFRRWQQFLFSFPLNRPQKPWWLFLHCSLRKRLLIFNFHWIFDHPRKNVNLIKQMDRFFYFLIQSVGRFQRFLQQLDRRQRTQTRWCKSLNWLGNLGNGTRNRSYQRHRKNSLHHRIRN